ncbi:MAG: hypothetical protein QOI74_1572 [Micromonosporaceae bacterium]|nr:hypothetical protein [Micromonosporaceae bacterium]
MTTGVRPLIPPGSSPTWTGLWSLAPTYPARQRFCIITADSGRAT